MTYTENSKCATKNLELIKAIMEECKQRGLYFLDSKTTMGSVCDEAAKITGCKYYSRDFFLEPPGRPSYSRAVEELTKAASQAAQVGKTVCIGHIGPVGDAETAKAILNSLNTIKSMGVNVVPLSKL